MDIHYEQIQQDLRYVQNLGCHEQVMTRLNLICHHAFELKQKLTEVERLLQKSRVSNARLKEVLFGKTAPKESDKQTKTGKTSTSTNPTQNTNANQDAAASTVDAANESNGHNPANKPDKAKPKGHGRVSASAYTGAVHHRFEVNHHQAGDICPDCQTHRLSKHTSLNNIVFHGAQLFQATHYEQCRLSCICGFVVTADAPVEVKQKYPTQCVAFLMYLHYYMGLPYNRIAKAQHMQGVPFPVSTQSEQVEKNMGGLWAIYPLLLKHAANGCCMFQDDTHHPIVEHMCGQQARKGMYISAFLTQGKQPVALFLPGQKHAGEHFDDLMAHRCDAMANLIRMSDALAANHDHQAKPVEVNCNAHAFRRFRSLKDEPFAREIMHYYGQVYRHEAHCKKNQLCDEARLAYHKTHSTDVMANMRNALESQLHHIEANSVLAGEIRYLLNHWHKLILFLIIPGVPLDNNPVERLLKAIIRYRKGSYFFRTQYSAQYACCIMSIIATCELNDVNAIDYLTALIEHEAQVWQNPSGWLPWCYSSSQDSCASQAA